MNTGPPLSHERRVLFLTLAFSAPSLLASGLLLFNSPVKLHWQVLIGVGLTAAALAGALVVRANVRRGLQRISTLVGSLREGDYSVRGRMSGARDALDEVTGEVNDLASLLATEQFRSLETTALLEKVMAEIDVAIFAFDEAGKLRLSNRAAERLVGIPSARLLGTAVEQLGMGAYLEVRGPTTVIASFPGGEGQWEVRRRTFRLHGRPHELVVLTNVQRALRQEQLEAWRGIVRVLGHEINNSLAPIQSIVDNLTQLVRQQPDRRLPDWEDDLIRGLAVISRRSESLGRFLGAYARLAKLPPPRFGLVQVGGWLRRCVELEKRVAVTLTPGPDLSVRGDVDQLEQVLINLVRNAVDAALETTGGVEVSWRVSLGHLEVTVSDEGPGLPNTHNLFVPFFTTKPQGSGIGLSLSRQIAEAHGGTLSLDPRRDRTGAVARLVLPL